MDDDSTILETVTPSSAKIELAPDGTDRRYDVGSLLGKGGMGEVRKAHDTRIEREVAVKVLRAELRDTGAVSRFYREAKVQGGLEHPAVPPVYDLGVDREGNPYFVMKKLAGTTLQDVIATRSQTRAHLLARFADVCFAIGFAHSRGVIHRDIKPANIMLGEFNEIYVLDWGLARRSKDDDSVQPRRRPPSESGTVDGDLLGTPGYMSPEQARGNPVTDRADVFSLGCVLYEILTGVAALPRGVAALAATLETKALSPRDKDPDVPPELDRLCAAATAPDPADRPSAKQLAEQLQAYLDGDRDEVLRKQAAKKHVETARHALAGTDDESRATAMREVGRALVLDPANEPAQALLQKLLIAPDKIPQAALAMADAERAANRQEAVKDSPTGFFLGAVFSLVLFTMPLRVPWLVVLLVVTSLVTGVVLMYIAKNPLPLRTPWELVILAANCLVLLVCGLVFGPLWLTPILTVGSLGLFLSQPTHRPAWLIIGAHVLVFVIPVGLELLDLAPSTFHTADGAFINTPIVELSPLASALLNVFALITQFGITIRMTATMRRTQETAQNRVHSQQ